LIHLVPGKVEELEDSIRASVQLAAEKKGTNGEILKRMHNG
jgi:hypothetical protein